jgi:multidrug resistance efflux pump
VVQAQMVVVRAKLDLERTEVRAPVDGYVTKLDVRVGDYAATGSPRLVPIDLHSYYIHDYFEETKLPQVHVGDPVDIRLMSGSVHLKGRITGIARGITDCDNPTRQGSARRCESHLQLGRLAQLVPVLFAVDEASVPKNVVLAAGMTATIDLR